MKHGFFHRSAVRAAILVTVGALFDVLLGGLAWETAVKAVVLAWLGALGFTSRLPWSGFLDGRSGRGQPR